MQPAATIRLDGEAITYFKLIAKGADISCQILINLNLRDRAASHRKLKLD